MSYVDPPKGRKMTPKGQMSSSGSGPAIMMMPPYIRATFMPDPPLKPLPPPRRRRPKFYRKDHISLDMKSNPIKAKQENFIKYRKVNAIIFVSSSAFCSIDLKNYSNGITGISDYISQFERSFTRDEISRKQNKTLIMTRVTHRSSQHKDNIARNIMEYKSNQRSSGGEYSGMNCYNTLFVGRLAYEVTERRLLRELEYFGPVKDLKLIVERDAVHKANDETNIKRNYKTKSKGYAFVEYEHEEDMKRAYREADAMKIEGREVVVDVERGHTVSNWLPRRLGGGLGGSRIGGKLENVNIPGRFDPSKPHVIQPGILTPSPGYFGAHTSVFPFPGDPTRGGEYFGEIPSQVSPLGYGAGECRRHDRGPPLGHSVYGFVRHGYTGGRFLNRPHAGCYGNISSIGRNGQPPNNRLNRDRDRAMRRRRSSSCSPDWKEDRRRRY